MTLPLNHCERERRGVQHGFVLGVLAALLGMGLVLVSRSWPVPVWRTPPVVLVAPRVAPHRPPPGLALAIARHYAIAPDAAQRVTDLAWRAAQRAGVPPSLFLAVVAVESRFNPWAGSRAGAVGLAQVRPTAHPATARRLGSAHWVRADSNLAWGAQILARCWHRYHGRAVPALQCYNGNPRDRHDRYARRVLGVEDWLRRASGVG